MSYYTRHTLTVLDKNYDEQAMIVNRLLEMVKRIDENADILFSIDEDGSYRQESKWYDDEQDMAAYSRWFPDVVFMLTGVGEDSDDQWIKYFRDGKMQVARATITYDKFDAAKLEEVKTTWNFVKHLEEEVFEEEE